MVWLVGAGPGDPELLLAAAREGQRVVLLKGGNPSIFDRSAEELAHLAATGVAPRI